MELLDRYLHAVRFWLPRAQRQDIIRELAGDIQSQIEEAEQERGAALDEAQVEAILHRFGHPILVAGRFLPQRCLIGPTLFPLYAFVLKLIAGFYVLPWLLVWLFFVIFVPSYRAEHPGLDLPATVQSLWLIAIHLFAFVTLAFAFLERSEAKSVLFARWNIRNLPAARDANRLSRGSAVASIVATTVFILWWVNVASFPAPRTARMAPVLLGYYWPVLLLLLAAIPIAVVDLFHPWWTRGRAAARLAIDGAWAVVACLLLVSGPWIHLSITNLPPDRAAAVVRWVNLPVLITLVVIGVASVFQAVQDVRWLVGRPTSANAQSRSSATGAT